MALAVKNMPASEGDIRAAGSIPGSGRSLGGVDGDPLLVFLPGESPWTEEPGGLQSRESQRVKHS